MSRSVMNPAQFRFSLRFGRIACIACAVACMILLWGSTDAGWAAPPLQADDGLLPAMLQVTGTIVNLRAGPGLSHAVRGQARQGTNLVVQGRSADDAWLAVTAPEGGAATLWIYADLTDVGASRYVLPWMGPPAVCTRSPDVRAALLTALAAHDRIRTCETATWADLAVLTHLPSISDDRLWLWEPHDLAGLTGLHTARVVVTDAYAAAGGRLSGLSGLEQLDLRDACCTDTPWPDHFLAGAMRLHDLAVEIQQVPVLPAAFLARVPHLQTLRLHLPHLTRLPAAFLAHVPHLTRLEVTAYALTALPASFLAEAPRLQTLDLRLAPEAYYYPHDFQASTMLLPESVCMPWRGHCKRWPRLQAPPTIPLPGHGYEVYHHPHGPQSLPAGFLARAPVLEDLKLRLPNAPYLPANFLADVPRLERLTLQAYSLTALPAGFLAHAPRLRKLSLAIDAASAPPMDFLAEAPALQELSLDLPDSETLPPGFLAKASRLEKLTLLSAKLRALPIDFLAETPALQELILDLPDWETLPPGFLAEASRLEKLTLLSAKLRALPMDFLTETPALQELSLEGQYRLETLPSGFLAKAPRLEKLTLSSSNLRALPVDFLAETPALQELALDLQRLASVPDDFLMEAPSLTRFQMRAPQLEALPPDFLARAPRLQDLSLDLYPFVVPIGFLADLPLLHTLSLFLHEAQALPPDFLAEIPALQELSLDLPRLEALPPDFLAEASRLKKLALSSSMLTALPPGFLDKTPALQELSLDLPRLEALPPDFLTEAPSLARFQMQARQLDALPPAFLARVPYLQDLALDLYEARALPADFLVETPALQELALDLPAVRALPADFLAEAPVLQDLYLNMHSLEALPPAFLARAPRLEQMDLSSYELMDLPEDILVKAPRLVDVQWHLPALTRIGPRMLADAAQLEQFHLSAPNLEFIDADFLARTPRLSSFTLLMIFTPFVPSPLSSSPGGLLYTDTGRPPLYQYHHPPGFFIGPGFLAGARNLQTVRLGIQGQVIELRPAADFLANLPRLRTVQLDAWLRDPPPPGFLRGTRVRDLSLRVRIAADAQGVPRLPAIVQAENWHLELACDSAYPPAWFTSFAIPPRVLTVTPCPNVREPPVLSALPSFLQGIPPHAKVRLRAPAQLARTDYAALPNILLQLGLDNAGAFAGWVSADTVQLHGDPVRVPVLDQPDFWRDDRNSGFCYVCPRRVEPQPPAHLNALGPRVPVRAAPRAEAPLLGYLPDAPDIRYPVLGRDGELSGWWLIPFNFLASAHLAEFHLTGAALRWPSDLLTPPTLRRATLKLIDMDFSQLADLRVGSALEALQLGFVFHPTSTVDAAQVQELIDRVAAPALLLDFNPPLPGRNQDKPPFSFLELIRTPPSIVRHLGLHGTLADLRPGVNAALATPSACLQLILPHLGQPPSTRLLAAARRRGLDLDLIPLPRNEGCTTYGCDATTAQPDVNDPFFYNRGSQEWRVNAAAYFQERHLPWAAVHACPRSLLLLDPFLTALPPDFFDQPGSVQRVRLAFDPLRCPACQPDP